MVSISLKYNFSPGSFLSVVSVILISFFFLLSNQLAAQTIGYDYDFAGNRIARRVIPLTKAPVKQQQQNESEPLLDKVGERQITIYPNPTKGRMIIDIQGGNEKDGIRVQMFDPQGKQLMNSALQPGKTTIDISSYPGGYYIMRITAGTKAKEYKVIKE